MKPYLVQVLYPDQEAEFSFIDNIEKKDEFYKEKNRLKAIYKNKVKFKKITKQSIINKILY